MFVDSHCHVAADWYEPVETLLHHMDHNAVSQAILIQLIGRHDHFYQQACTERYPGRFASVVGIDPTAADAPEQVRGFVNNGARGIRMRPNARSVGEDPLAVWRAADEQQIPVSCVGTAAMFAAAEFFQLVQSFPRLIFILEHLGASNQPDVNDGERAARARVFELAQFPNVYLKMPGLGELIPRAGLPPSPNAAANTEVLQAAVRSFGAERLMWGSDFPLVSSREGYANALRWPRAVLSHLSAAQQALIFSGNARRIFGLASS
jgi:L-fuconolactonase